MIRLQLIFWLAAVLQCLQHATPSRILGMFPVQSTSHHSMNQIIMKTLAARGHQVTVLSSFAESSGVVTPNYTDISLGVPVSSSLNFVDSVTEEGAKELAGFFHYLKLITVNPIERDLCSAVLSHEYVQNVLRGKIQPPELLIVETYHVICYSSIAEKLDIPVISLVAPGDIYGMDYAIGNPIYTTYVPSFLTGYTQNMNFQERLVNWAQFIFLYVSHYSFNVQITLDLDKKYVGNKDVTSEKLCKRISLVFFNNHFSFLHRPTVPNAIEVGGIHIKQAKPLLPEIEKFIEEAQHGVILFSFGSALKMSSLSEEKINTLKKAFSQIPQRILWRSDVLNLTDVPSNVMIRKWFAQRDILEHKNVKAFISHGGLFGTYEAIYTGTPVIGIPFMFDQFTNVNILQEKGAAISLDYESLDYKTLLDALTNIINDPRYYQNMQNLSAVFKDRPMSPLDTAIYWTEYVIRHKGAPHLRTVAADMPFYKYLLLDVIAFVVIVPLITMYFVYYILKSIFCSKRAMLPQIAKKTQ